MSRFTGVGRCLRLLAWFVVQGLPLRGGETNRPPGGWATRARTPNQAKGNDTQNRLF